MKCVLGTIKEATIIPGASLNGMAALRKYKSGNPVDLLADRSWMRHLRTGPKKCVKEKTRL